ncbi:MAG: G5 domain-containing protein [Oscillospiraceae bacterium]|nr:G5 domain-containing protein [Oscillospiraceae bacterium]
MQKILSGAKSLVSKVKPRHFIIAFFALSVAFVMLWSASRIKTVTVDNDGEITVFTTAISSPYAIMDKMGIEPGPDDKVSIKGFENSGFFGNLGTGEAEIRIQSAVEVEVSADNLRYHVTVSEGDTVSDVLEISGLEVREHDFLNMDGEKAVSEGDDIKLTRVDYITTTEEETIQRGTTVRGTSLLKSNKQVLISYGKNGTKLLTYQQKVVDGVYGEKELVSEEITKRATDDIYLIGDGSPISPLDYGFEIVDGVPTTYEKVYENVRATGYYAPYGAGTATGRRAQMGYVAVDPKIIPYGTKMWIVAHNEDTGFVYGYALAADTGGAMLSGKNFVDLYYDTYYECVLNGLRKVDVYILETPKKD